MTSTLALQLAGNYEAGTAIGAGLVGAIAMLAVIYMGKATGMTSMHLMMGAAFGLVHAGLLHGVDPSTDGGAAAFGALFGLVHGAMVTMVLPVMLTMAHPLVRSGESPAPG